MSYIEYISLLLAAISIACEAKCDVTRSTISGGDFGVVLYMGGSSRITECVMMDLLGGVQISHNWKAEVILERTTFKRCK